MRNRRWWTGLGPLPKAALILAAVLFCCGLTVTGGWNNRDLPPAAAPTRGLEAAASSPADSASPSPTVVIRVITEIEKIPFEEETVEDSSLLEGSQKILTNGVAGELTITYEVTITAGEETDRRAIREEVTREPVNQVLAVGTRQPEPEREPEPRAEPDCHPGYAGACVPVGVSDVDCAGRGNGPAYVRGPVWIIGDDPYRLDPNRDGVACE